MSSQGRGPAARSWQAPPGKPGETGPEGRPGCPMEPREAPRRKNLHFLRLYMLERRKTDTVVEGSAPGERAGPLRRTQSDRSEYSQKLQGR